MLLLHLGVDGNDRVFQIDSGSPTSYVRPGLFGQATDGAAETLKLSRNGELLATVEAEPKDLIPFRMLPKLGGILGADFLSQVVLAVSDQKGAAYLWRTADEGAATAAQWLDRQASGGVGPWTDVPALHGQDARLYLPVKPGMLYPLMCLDTGSFLSNLSTGALASIRHIPVGKVNATTLGGPARFDLDLIADLELPLSRSPVTTVVVTDDRFGPFGMIGLDVLHTGNWILDLSRHKFEFQSYERQPRVSLSNKWSTIYSNGTDFSVSLDIVPYNATPEFSLVKVEGLPVASALSIPSSTPVSDRSLRTLADQLKKLYSKPFQLTIASGGKLKDVGVLVER